MEKVPYLTVTIPDNRIQPIGTTLVRVLLPASHYHSMSCPLLCSAIPPFLLFLDEILEFVNKICFIQEKSMYVLNPRTPPLNPIRILASIHVWAPAMIPCRNRFWISGLATGD
jgi:hypothetical protein